MVTRKSDKEIKILKEGGKILAKILKTIVKSVRPGISAYELNELAERLIKESGAKPAFLGYRPHGARRPFPAALCVSKNSVVVHGIPSRELILQNSDIVSFDLGILYKNMVTDAAVSIGVGRISSQAKKLLKVTQYALDRGIKACRVGNTVGDIGSAIENYVKRNGFFVIRELVGHGVGYGIHEEPNIPNYGQPQTGIALEHGMVLAVEPMVSIGGEGVVAREDGSFVTRDGSLAAHFEHTVVVTKNGPMVLTK
ncbi:MAG: type I methionyl aminopeptidase [Candidatus Paceibacteria bacterium]